MALVIRNLRRAEPLAPRGQATQSPAPRGDRVYDSQLLKLIRNSAPDETAPRIRVSRIVAGLEVVLSAGIGIRRVRIQYILHAHREPQVLDAAEGCLNVVDPVGTH